MSLIAITSDSHDNIPNIDKFLNYCRVNNIQRAIHCGDITTDETKQYFIDKFEGEIDFIEGNADIQKEKDKQLKKTNPFQVIKRLPVPFLELEIDNIRIAVCHKKDKAERLGGKNVYELVYFGHTHKPWEEMVENSKLLNPGTLAGMFTPPTFAVLDTITKKHTLVLVNEI